MTSVTLTSLNKVMWPATGFTKGEMIDYYRGVSGALLPHVRGRPLTLGRFPEGVEGPGFAQTECRGRPEWMRTRRIRTRGGEWRRFCVVEDAAGLVWVANQNAIELHAFPAPDDDLRRPAAVIFDLDSGPGADLLDCCRVSILLRQVLAQVGLEGFVKTTGGAGLHVFVPVGGRCTYAQTKSFARSVAEHLAGSHHDRVTASVRGDREGRVLIDWLQNSRMRTTVCAYSLRAAERPVVSTPVLWEEIDAAIAARAPERVVFGPDRIRDRLKRVGDPFRPTLELRQRLPA